MIGKYQLQLGAEQLSSGMASSDYATDGALGVSSFGLNPFLTAGIMRPLVNSATITSPVVGNMIASAEDSQTSTVFARTMVDDVGKYYTTNGSTITLQNTGVATTKYIAGKTDMVAFAGNTYVTLTDNVAQWNTGGTPTLDETWWTGTKGQSALNANVPHPMLAYQGNMYIANANVLDTVDSSGTVALNVLVLNTNEIIQALHIDPLTGLMMVSVQTTININDTLSTAAFVYLYDGISAKATRKIPVDDLITGFHSVEGNVFVGQGFILGQWNGNGVTFLRKLQNLTFTGSPTDLIYKHKMANTRNILHIVDGQMILSYGAVTEGKKAFFYTGYNLVNTNHISCVMPFGTSLIGVAYIGGSSTKTVGVFDFGSTAAGSAVMYFNNIYFPRPVYIRRLRYFTTGTTTTALGGTVTVIDEKQVSHQTDYLGFIVTSAQSPRYLFDFDFTSLKLQGMEIRQSFGSVGGEALIRVVVYYDIAE